MNTATQKIDIKFINTVFWYCQFFTEGTLPDLLPVVFLRQILHLYILQETFVVFIISTLLLYDINHKTQITTVNDLREYLLLIAMAAMNCGWQLKWIGRQLRYRQLPKQTLVMRCFQKGTGNKWTLLEYHYDLTMSTRTIRLSGYYTNMKASS